MESRTKLLASRREAGPNDVEPPPATFVADEKCEFPRPVF